MLAFVILSQTFMWSNKSQFQTIKERIVERNMYYQECLSD